MPATTIRIRAASHEALKEIVAITGRSLQDELDDAIELRRRMLYLEGLKADYAALAKDPRAMAEFKKEVDLWDTAGNDGLEEL
jgi:hypothetical protein